MKNIILFSFALLLFLSSKSYSQIDIWGKIKEKAEQKAEEKTDEAINKGFEEAEETIKKNIEQSNDKEKTTELEEEEKVQTKKTETNNENIETEKSEFSVYSKYDFVPGELTLFYDDFSDVEIGDFPMNWDTKSSGEVVTIKGLSEKWFKMQPYSTYIPIINSIELPENFTIEFDVVTSEGLYFGFIIFNFEGNNFPDEYFPGAGGTELIFSNNEIAWKVYDNNKGIERNGSGVTNRWIESSERVRYSIWGQKNRLRVYCQQDKIIDIPRGVLSDIKLNTFRFYAHYRLYLTNFRISAGMPDVRNRLLKEGKFISYGITFDVSSDKIKPESFAALKEIATVLIDNPSVAIRIVGHTDSDGSEASNLELSKRRAESVKNKLNTEFGIDIKRMQTDGKGESQPISDNNTSLGKAKNRRVEFIKE